jgi:UDP-GlcNAc:undecaprenyl-phosphate GlcNAc-1-phosphate transferase
VLGVPFVDLFLIVWRRWRRGVPFYSPGQDHVHHDLVLVHGFSQRKSVLLLYSWCIMLSGLAIAIQRESPWGKILLGIGATVATVYMLQLLSRYRSRHRGLPDPLAPGVGNNPTAGPEDRDGPPDASTPGA